VNSQTLCGHVSIRFQRRLSLYDILNFYYVVELRKVEASDRSFFMVGIMNRDDYLRKGDDAALLASSRRDINAKIMLFSYDSETAELCPSERFVLDVRAAPNPLDELVVVKEVYEGKIYLYAIPCSAEVKSLCEKNVQRVGCYLYKKRNKTSNCFDIDVSECLSSPSPSCWGV